MLGYEDSTKIMHQERTGNEKLFKLHDEHPHIRTSIGIRSTPYR